MKFCYLRNKHSYYTAVMRVMRHACGIRRPPPPIGVVQKQSEPAGPGGLATVRSPETEGRRRVYLQSEIYPNKSPTSTGGVIIGLFSPRRNGSVGPPGRVKHLRNGDLRRARHPSPAPRFPKRRASRWQPTVFFLDGFPKWNDMV